LTETEAVIVGVLHDRDIATTDCIMANLYSGSDRPEPKIIDVMICRIRKNFKKYGIEIETVWGQGYSLSHEMKLKLKRTLDARQEAA